MTTTASRTSTVYVVNHQRIYEVMHNDENTGLKDALRYASLVYDYESWYETTTLPRRVRHWNEYSMLLLEFSRKLPIAPKKRTIEEMRQLLADGGDRDFRIEIWKRTNEQLL